MQCILSSPCRHGIEQAKDNVGHTPGGPQTVPLRLVARPQALACMYSLMCSLRLFRNVYRICLIVPRLHMHALPSAAWLLYTLRVAGSRTRRCVRGRRPETREAAASPRRRRPPPASGVLGALGLDTGRTLHTVSPRSCLLAVVRCGSCFLGSLAVSAPTESCESISYCICPVVKPYI